MSEGKKPFIKDYHLCLTCDRQIGSLLKLSGFCIKENLRDMDGVKTRLDKKRKSVAVQTTCLQTEQFLAYKTNMLGRSRWFFKFRSYRQMASVQSCQRLQPPNASIRQHVVWL
jgi:hypothetical protein